MTILHVNVSQDKDTCYIFVSCWFFIESIYWGTVIVILLPYSLPLQNHHVPAHLTIISFLFVQYTCGFPHPLFFLYFLVLKQQYNNLVQ